MEKEIQLFICSIVLFMAALALADAETLVGIKNVFCTGVKGLFLCGI
jgi:hypothetical protein